MNRSIEKLNAKPKKKLAIFFGALAVIFVALFVADFSYRKEFTEFDNEVKRVASFLPEGAIEDKTDQSKKGNGLLERLQCYIVGGGMPCPIVSSDYSVPTTSDESMILARKVLQDSGYEIESDDLPGTIGGDCVLKRNDPCTLVAGHGKHSVLLWQRITDEGPIVWSLTIDPSLK